MRRRVAGLNQIEDALMQGEPRGRHQGAVPNGEGFALRIEFAQLLGARIREIDVAGARLRREIRRAEAAAQSPAMPLFQIATQQPSAPFPRGPGDGAQPISPAPVRFALQDQQGAVAGELELERGAAHPANAERGQGDAALGHPPAIQAQQGIAHLREHPPLGIRGGEAQPRRDPRVAGPEANPGEQERQEEDARRQRRRPRRAEGLLPARGPRRPMQIEIVRRPRLPPPRRGPPPQGRPPLSRPARMIAIAHVRHYATVHANSRRRWRGFACGASNH